MKHYERAGYDVLAVTDHWVRSDPPSTERLLVLPSAELNCLLPGGRDGHVLALGIDDALESLEGERLDLAGDGGLDHGTRRRRVPRPPLLDRRHAGHTRAAGDRLGDRDLQRRLRARDRPRPVGRALGRAPRGRAPLLRPRDRRQPSPGVRLRSRLDVGSLGADPRRCSRRLEDRLLLRLHRARAFRRSAPATARSWWSATRVAASPSSSESRAEHPCTRAGSGTATAARSSPRLRTDRSRQRAWIFRRPLVTHGSRSRTNAAGEPGRTPYGRSRLARGRAEQSSPGRPTTCSSSVAASSAPGSRTKQLEPVSGSPSSTGRTSAAPPRARPRSSSTVACATSGSATSSSSAKPTRSGAHCCASLLRTSSGRSRSCSLSIAAVRIDLRRSRPGSGPTRPLQGRSSAASSSPNGRGAAFHRCGWRA